MTQDLRHKTLFIAEHNYEKVTSFAVFLFTLPFIIPHTVLLSSIQPEAENLDFSTQAVLRNL